MKNLSSANIAVLVFCIAASLFVHLSGLVADSVMDSDNAPAKASMELKSPVMQIIEADSLLIAPH